MYLLLFTSHYKVLEFLFSEALEDEKNLNVCVLLYKILASASSINFMLIGEKQYSKNWKLLV